MAFLRDKSVFCIPKETLSFNERYIISSICLGTSSIGFLGAALQLRALWQFRDRQRRRPSADPRIIFYLALSDLIACVGIFVIALCLMLFELPTEDKQNKHLIPQHDALYASVGTTVEVFTLFAYLASYIWTFSFALDMCFQIYRIECAMIVYHIIAWLIPFWIVTCIEVYNYERAFKYCLDYTGRIYRLVLSYVPVMVIMIANPLLLIITYRKVKQYLRSSGSFTVVDRSALNMCKRKFFWMVLVFTVCWFPNIISVSYDLVTSSPSQIKKTKLDNLWYLEAFVNPLQGIFNYFVYRHSFKVTASDMRPPRDSLPRVSRTTFERPNYNRREKRSRSKLTVQKFQGSGSGVTVTDEETPLLGQSRSTEIPANSYVSRLLGE